MDISPGSQQFVHRGAFLEYSPQAFTVQLPSANSLLQKPSKLLSPLAIDLGSNGRYTKRAVSTMLVATFL
jgi:hypothetical protein